ncbi:MAG TPA: cytochrome c oxidase subunit I [Longimicrobiales bacterium]|nr:cytochrome c oxidase subunit I [Longimicrobiales bacterium]
MATVEAHAPATAAGHRRTGIWDWITTIDHKKVGILYGVTALIFLFIGGLEAMVIRTQLMQPDMKVVSPDFYNELFTMHGLTMIFLVGMPIAVAMFNYIVPLQIGARDVAFPRLNALSYWVFLLGGLFLYSGFFIGQAPNNGWFGYSPLTSLQYSPGLNMDFYALGLQILGIASIMGGINFITTIVQLRAPGMKFMRMPLFTWMAFVTSFIMVTALPVLAVALFFLTFDRFWGTNFFQASAGGDPILWQHLFWLFGHPEVYILILPGFGVVSDVIPTFSRKPLFGYAVMVYAGALIAFIGWGVWSHHMFATGIGTIADAFFTTSTMIIAIPTGVKIFNWLATMWGGRLRFTTSMKFAVSMVAMFTIGGVSGIMHAVSPADLQQTDTYFVVAHFHYVLIGGLISAVISGLYYWYPKITGRLMSEKIGNWNFWLFFISFNVTFFPMHFIGLLGMPRRVYTYAPELGLGGWNLLATLGAYVMGVSMLLLAWNLVRSLKKGKPAGNNPWQAATLEWATSSPPPEYNFAQLPEIRGRMPLWDNPDAYDERVWKEPEGGVHMPNPSYWPILTATGIAATLILFMTHLWWAPLLGLGWTMVCVFNFAFEPAG